MTESVFGKNLALLKQKENAASSVRDSIFRQAAEYYVSTASDNITADGVSGFFSQTFSENDLLTDDFAVFCREVAILANEKISFSFSFGDREQKSGLSPKIAYHRSPLSDRAYSLFSDKISNSSAVYPASFKDICEDVYYGRSDYAIIPIYTSSDGILSSFRKLILKYDLKIIYMAKIEQDDVQTRFVLLQKWLSPLEYSDDEKETNIVISLIPGQDQKLGSLISALSVTGNEIDFIGTNTVEYSVTESCYDISFRTLSKSIPALLLFLEGSHIRFELLGIYKTIA